MRVRETTLRGYRALNEATAGSIYRPIAGDNDRSFRISSSASLSILAKSRCTTMREKPTRLVGGGDMRRGHHLRIALVKRELLISRERPTKVRFSTNASPTAAAAYAKPIQLPPTRVTVA